jgi:hypothetical protein
MPADKQGIRLRAWDSSPPKFWSRGLRRSGTDYAREIHQRHGTIRDFDLGGYWVAFTPGEP